MPANVENSLVLNDYIHDMHTEVGCDAPDQMTTSEVGVC